MRIRSLIFLLFIRCLASSAPVHLPVAYHFSPDGDDDRSIKDAQHALTPWQSLSKLDSLVLFPGDSVLFHRGGTYPGCLTAARSGKSGRPIHYGAYGKGTMPVINGAVPIQGWRLFRDRIFVADSPRPVRQLFVDGAPMVLARYPNHGYLPIRRAIGDDAFQAAGLDLKPPRSDSLWKGAAIHIKSERFSLDARRVIKFDPDSGIFHLNRRTTYPMKPGRGFFLNGALEALDTAGEWYCDSARGKIYAWMPGGDSTGGHSILGTVWDHGFQAKDQSNLRVENIRFAFPAESGIHLTNASEITIRNCAVDFSGGEGMTLVGRAFSVEDNSINGAVQAGVLLRGSGSRLLRNRITGTGLLERIGREGFGGGCCRGNAIECYGDSNRISENRLSVSGYNGIRFEGVNSLIEKNLIDSSCMTFDDGGGIYTWAAKYSDRGSTGSLIRKNIILNSLGTGEGTGDTATSAHGIYLDHCVQGLRVTGNTVANADIGIYLHDTRNHLLSGNVLYHNRSIQLYLKRDYLDSGEMFGNKVSGNVFYSTAKEQEVRNEKIYETSNPKPLAAYAGNYLCLTDSSGQSCSLDAKTVWRNSQAPGSRLRYNFAGESRSLSPIRGGFQSSANSVYAGTKKLPLFTSKIVIPGAPDFLPSSRSPAGQSGNL